MIWWLGWAMLLGQPIARPAPVPMSQAGDTPQAAVARGVTVWSDHEGPYERGAKARVFIATTETAYVTVVRIDTDGRLRILYPRAPWADNQIRAGRTVALSGRNGTPFQVDDPPGLGYLFALSSPDPFVYDAIARGDHWDFRLVEGGRVAGDPFAFFTDLALRLAPEGEYDYDVMPYQVEGRYEYPRFVCYECHAARSFEAWDPYRTACSRFRLVVYDHPAYYPYRWQAGRNVVAPRPARAAPRFVFRDWSPGAEYVTHVDEPAAAERRAPGELRRTELRRTNRGDSNWRRLAPGSARPLRGRRDAAEKPRSTGEPELRRRKPD